MLRLVGYSDRLSVEPGGTIRFMVSCEAPTYEARLVRLLHGDENPDGPGFRQLIVPSPADGTYPGRHQEIRSGSFVELPLPPEGVGPDLEFSTWLWPTLPGAGEQAIASLGDPDDGGWALILDASGALAAVTAGDRLTTGRGLQRWTWYRVSLRVAGGRATLEQAPLRSWPGDPSSGGAEGPLDVEAGRGPLLLGAIRAADGTTRAHLDGKLDGPVLEGVGAWDFGADIATDRVTDRSGNGLHGRTVNLPTRGVTGHAFDGTIVDYHDDPAQYAAVHLHRDDLEDAGWEVGVELTVPDDLPSGVYALWLRAGDDEDHLPFTVRPPRGVARSRIAILMSTLTYTVYANFTDLGPGAWREDATNTWTSSAPHADPTLLRDVYRYIDEHALYGTYDLHVDSSGVAYGSFLRPILNMRPKFRYRVWAAPPRFPADLYLVDWLEHEGIAVDVLTDHDLHAEGADLLAPYAAVISSSHHEYWSGRMLDGLEAYLGAGGRFLLLGGNSLYGVASFDPVRPHVVEVRRWGAPWPFEVAPGERVHSTTGEPGGTWRNRGRPPNGIVGVGTSAAGFDRAVPYRRMPASYDPRVAWIFEGVEGNLIGDHPNLQTRWGAAGYEIDRFDHELGTPPTAILLASSVGFSDLYRPMVDDVMWYVPGRDGRRPDDPQVEGEPHRFVRADMAYLEYPNGGAAFSVGSIAWRGALAWNGYDNSVARVTRNVLRRFADWPRGTSPGAPAAATEARAPDQ